MFDKKEHLLRYVAGCCRLYGTCSTSTIRIAKNSKLPQQTISRVLHELFTAGLIEKISSPKGISLKMTKKGIDTLKEDYLLLEKLFSKQGNEKIEGKVLTGLGEGSYYLSNSTYTKRIKDAIGFLPFKGTLNIKVDEETVRMLELATPIRVEGFVAGKRSFGGANLYPATAKNSIKAAVIIPDRSHYKGTTTIEIISSTYLRGSLKLKDGDKLSIVLGAYQ